MHASLTRSSPWSSANRYHSTYLDRSEVGDERDHDVISWPTSWMQQGSSLDGKPINQQTNQCLYGPEQLSLHIMLISPATSTTVLIFLLQLRWSLWAVLFSMHVEILCTPRLCIWDRPAQTWHSRSWHPHCRRRFPEKIWQLFSWPEIRCFINGPMIKGFSEPGPVFLICCSPVGAAAIGCCAGSTIMSVLPHCKWCLLLAENVLWAERWKGRIVNVRQRLSKFKVARTLADFYNQLCTTE